jgi:hypothetical protein
MRPCARNGEHWRRRVSAAPVMKARSPPATAPARSIRASTAATATTPLGQPSTVQLSARDPIQRRTAPWSETSAAARYTARAGERVAPPASIMNRAAPTQLRPPHEPTSSTAARPGVLRHSDAHRVAGLKVKVRFSSRQRLDLGQERTWSTIHDQ